MSEITIGTLIAILAVLISYIGYLRAKDNDKAIRVAELAKMKEQIVSLRLEIEEVKSDMRANDGKIEKRLDKLDEKIDMINQNLLNLFNKKD